MVCKCEWWFELHWLYLCSKVDFNAAFIVITKTCLLNTLCSM